MMSYEETEAAYNFRVSVENAPHFTADIVYDYLKAQFGGLPSFLKFAEEENKKAQWEVFGEVKEIPDFSQDLCDFSVATSYSNDFCSIGRSFLVHPDVRDLPEEFFYQPNVHIDTAVSPWRYWLLKEVNLLPGIVQLAKKKVNFVITTGISATTEVPEETERFLRSIPGKVVEETNTVTNSRTSLICEI